MDWISAAIAGASAIGGGIVVAASNSRIRKADAEEGTRAALLSAVVGYLHMLELIGLEAARQPSSGRAVSALNRFIERRAPQLDYTTGRLHEAIFTPYLRTLMDRYSLAANQLLMVAPRELLQAVQRVNELLEEFESPDQGWIEEWQEARGRLVRTCRDIVGPEAS
jgi:hypothetical protein